MKHIQLRGVAILLALSFIGPINSLAQSSSVITTVVGPPLPASGLPAISQAIDSPTALALDGHGGFYVTSQTQNRIYDVSADGTLTLIAGSSYGFGGDGGRAVSARLASPSGLAVDTTGNLYIADTNNNRVRKVSSDGVITTVAGDGNAGLGGDGGPARSAQLSGPIAVAVDSTGTLYIADSQNQRVRAVSTDGTIRTVAGGGTTNITDGALATSVRLDTPRAVAIDFTGNLYVGNSGSLLRVSSTGIITKLATALLGGRFNQICFFSGDEGPASSASLCGPRSVAVDGIGNIVVTDSNDRIRKITTDGMIHTVAGSGQIAYAGDGGPASAAALSNPDDAIVDAAGNIYIADTTNNRIRVVTPDGIIHTRAGNGTSGFADGVSALTPQLTTPYSTLHGQATGVVTDRAGNLYVADTGENRVRKVTPDGTIQTLAGNGTAGLSGDEGPAALSQIAGPSALAVDLSGNVYLLATNAVRKVTTDGIIHTIAGVGGTGCVSPPVPLSLCGPRGIAVDRQGNVYISEPTRVLKLDSAGNLSTIAGILGVETFSGDGGLATAATLLGAGRLAIDVAGNLFISEDDARVRRISTDGIITTVAGNGTCSFVVSDIGDGGNAVSAQVCPGGIAVDSSGNLWIADMRSRVRVVSPDGKIRTGAGNGVYGFSGDGGSSVLAQLDEPADVTVDAAGNVYIVDLTSARVRKLSPAAATQPYSLVTTGASYLAPTPLDSSPVVIGYAHLQPATGSSTTPYGAAVFSYRSNGVIVSEAAVPASPAIQTGRIFVESASAVRTGMAIANPNNADALISYYFTDQDGVDTVASTLRVPAHQQISAFLDEAPFHGSGNARALTFSSSVPVGAIALRGLLNERGDFLMTTLPVAAIGSSMANVILPHFAAGGGWTTEVLLVNPTDQTISGAVAMDGVRSYTIAPRSSVKIRSGNPNALLTGAVVVTPASGHFAPVASSVFTLVSGGVTVTESGIATTGVAQSFRVFAESNPSSSLQTGIAIANTASSAANVRLNMLDLNGQSTGYSGTMVIQPNDHVSLFLNEIQGLQYLPSSFRGVLNITSDQPISAVGLRTRYNERHDFLISTTPAVQTSALLNGDLIFPQLVTGAGYTTEFLLLNTGAPSQGMFTFTSQWGEEMPLTLPK